MEEGCAPTTYRASFPKFGEGEWVLSHAGRISEGSGFREKKKYLNIPTVVSRLKNVILLSEAEILIAVFDVWIFF